MTAQSSQDPQTPQDARRGRRARWAPRVAAGAAVTAVLSLTAYGVLGRPPAASAVGLQPFGDCTALAEWSRDALEPLVTPWGLSGGEGFAVAGTRGAADLSMPALPMAASGSDAGLESAGAADASAAVGPGATGTNLQEAGVDEPDLVKTDGDLLVTTVEGRLVVVDVTGTEPRTLGEVEVPALTQEGWAGTGELLLVGDRVVVLASSSYALDAPTAPDAATTEPALPGRLLPGDLSGGAVAVDPAISYAPGVPTTTATVVDVSDPAAPSVVTSTEVEGRYVSAREAGGVVRLVSSSTPVLPFVTSTSTQYDETGQVVDDPSLQANLQVLEAAGGQDLLPHIVVRDSSGAVTSRVPAVDCAAVSHPAEPAGIGTVTVRTLDVAAASAGADPVVDAVGVSADGDLVYASTDRLYVATTRGGWTSPDPADDEIRTALHGFDIADPSRTTYLASGEVPGYLLGRWALSARDGYLRVATTRGDMWAGGGSSDSAVTVLAEGADGLTPVGEVGGLGVGEQVRAVRWFDDSAVVVTFRQTDPLYVVDLADPAAPVLRGELKVPGYSGYLHPLGADRMLGVGQDATETGQTLGVQVSSFDLTDPTAPTRVDVLTEEGTWSDVEGDSRAFSYLPDRAVALLPVSGDDGSSLRAVHVDAAGALTEVGSWSVPSSTDTWGYLQRAVPVGADRVAVLVQTSSADGETSTAVTLLTLDDLAEAGSTDL